MKVYSALVALLLVACNEPGLGASGSGSSPTSEDNDSDDLPEGYPDDCDAPPYLGEGEPVPEAFVARSTDDLEVLRGVREIRPGLVLSHELFGDGEGSVGSLAALKCLRKTGLLIIEETDLTTLEGLEFLSVAGTVHISKNEKLLTTQGLGLRDLSGGLTIDYNPKLEEIRLDQLETAVGVRITANDALLELHKFSKLDDVRGVLDIYTNPVLRALNGFLDNAGAFREGARIFRNHLLDWRLVRDGWAASGQSFDLLYSCENLGEEQLCGED